MNKRRTKYDKEHPQVIEAKARVPSIIDSIDPADLALAIKNSPSLRGMIMGYIAEVKFEKEVLEKIPEITDIREFDDHNRAENKSDRAFRYNSRVFGVQLKSIQTNSIKWSNDSSVLIADIQNDGSDKRIVALPNGNSVNTTNYRKGDYEILAVPLFPYTNDWSFAYKLNRDCRTTASPKYSEEDRQYLLATTERISFPLSSDWETDLLEICDQF